MDGAESGTVLVLGTVLAVGLLVGVPATVAWTLYHEARPAAASLIVAILALAILNVVRDVRARRWGWTSTLLAASWILCLAYAGIRMVIE